ncbi:hypothetical protein CI610_00631 [invertebrate metagenome]|uniref:Uncharacterized protein n=1 Tax=invertebrate metagenome TaxID=1711999 RepID=A0A2H9TB33_9ZZZZ
MEIDALTGRVSSYVNPLKESQQDFIHGVFLERGNMLDAEVRRIVGEIETSNALIHSVNNLIAKSNIHQHSTMSYSQATWKVSGDEKSIALDHGYGISLQKDGNNNNTFIIEDGKGNQLVYNNQTLVPVPAGKAVDALEVGIPVMNNMTFVLSDGTELTFLPAEPDSAYNASSMSGGLADIQSIVISRGNQAMKIDNLTEESPNIIGPIVDPNTSPEDFTEAAHSIQANAIISGQNYSSLPSKVDTIKSEWMNYVDTLSNEGKEALKAKLVSEGMTLNWSASEALSFSGEYRNSDRSASLTENYSNNNNYKAFEGEEFDAFFTRILSASSSALVTTISQNNPAYDLGISGQSPAGKKAATKRGTADWEDLIYLNNRTMNSASLKATLPDFSYTKQIPNGDINHAFDTEVNDGHVLIESGGLHQWEYDGVLTKNIQTNNLNNPSQSISGYFARKQAFHNAVNSEHTSTGTFLTQEERDMLAKVLKVTYSDASGTGNLTGEEWESLQKSLEAARNNLTGSNQLQATQLQRALTSHNQNYDAISNSLSRIYTLLKDIVARM